MKNRFIALFLTAFMMITVLSGCQNASSGKSDTSADSSDKVEINIYHCTFNIASADSAEVQVIEDAINDYIADKINVKIKLTDLGQGEYEEKCNLAIANGEANLFWTASWMGSVSTDSLVSGKAAYDLSELLQGTDLYDSIPEAVWESSQYNGKDYFIPC